ncbi:MAG: hypothetical protein ACOYMB_02440 [Patescibacteria group bacterium]
MKKIVVLLVVGIFCIAVNSFGQRKSDQLKPRNVEIGIETSGFQSGVNVSYNRSWYNLNVLKTVSNNASYLELSGCVFGKASVGKNQTTTFGLKMNYFEHKIIVQGNSEEVPLATKNINGSYEYFMNYYDLKKSSGLLREVRGSYKSTISNDNCAVTVTINLELKGITINKTKDLAINPIFSGSIYNKPARDFPDLQSFVAGIRLVKYDFKKFYSREIVSLEYQKNGSIYGPANYINLSVNLLGVIDLFKKEPKKPNYITYRNLFPRPEHFDFEENILVEKYKKFTDFQLAGK